MLTSDHDTGEATVHGQVAPGFEGVREAFEQVVRDQPLPTGQQLAVHHDGARVVDLWAGPGVEGDTVTGVFSISKGAAYMVVALLVQDGVLDLDRTVASYWPEFGQAGKENITLRQLLAHQAGAIGVDEHLTIEELADEAVIAARLAPQAPYWTPGTGFGYHGLTISALLCEVVRRATGRSLQDWWEQRVRRPRDIGFYLGLPPELDSLYLDVTPAVPGPGDEVPPQPGKLEAIAFSRSHMPDLSVFPNFPLTRALGQGSAGGVASARGTAAAYAAVIGVLDGSPALLDPDTTEEFTRIHSEGIDLVGGGESRFALGFQTLDNRYTALGPDAFGHGGAAGAMAFASPSDRLAYAYIRSRFALGDSADRENTLMIEAMLAAVRGR
ncbi:serine hydrolase domain-containing protein [Streptomyces sp. NPDC048301]|uniref:serine hydrolase domain-containing protein n=1 Tax=Streptomyces sp. NPDC048301 TaxID=3155631 RepID=UPI00341D4A8F